MLVTTAMVGESIRKEPSDSSASATRNFPWPSLALVPMAFELAADDDGRVDARHGRGRGHHGGGGGLAVGAGDGDAVLHAHQLGQHLGARDHRDHAAAWAATTSGLSSCTAVEMTTTSAFCTFSAAWPMPISPPEAGQPLGGVRAAQVGAGDLVAQVEQHLGDAAHADAADADEMNFLYFPVHEASASP